jgi:putrescine transport system substrate-binding protein
MRPEVHASLSNQVLYANPNKEARKFVAPEVANNPAVFPTAAQLATMVAPKSMTNDTRRLQTRVFTGFKTGR